MAASVSSTLGNSIPDQNSDRNYNTLKTNTEGSTDDTTTSGRCRNTYVVMLDMTQARVEKKTLVPNRAALASVWSAQYYEPSKSHKNARMLTPDSRTPPNTSKATWWIPQLARGPRSLTDDAFQYVNMVISSDNSPDAGKSLSVLSM